MFSEVAEAIGGLVFTYDTTWGVFAVQQCENPTAMLVDHDGRAEVD